MSQAASGYDRIEGDAYFTPAWVTEALFSAETFHGAIWDTCAGAGNILDVAKAHGHEVLGIDINPVERVDMTIAKADGLSMAGTIPNAIINPPYGRSGTLAVSFIMHALARTEAKRGKVAALLRVDFDSAHTRRHLFADHPAFAAKYTLTKRIRWANLPQVDEYGKKTSGPTDNHMWAVWDWSKRRDTPRAYGYLP